MATSSRILKHASLSLIVESFSCRVRILTKNYRETNLCDRKHASYTHTWPALPPLSSLLLHSCLTPFPLIFSSPFCHYPISLHPSYTIVLQLIPFSFSLCHSLQHPFSTYSIIFFTFSFFPTPFNYSPAFFTFILPFNTLLVLLFSFFFIFPFNRHSFIVIHVSLQPSL